MLQCQSSDHRGLVLQQAAGILCGACAVSIVWPLEPQLASMDIAHLPIRALGHASPGCWPGSNSDDLRHTWPCMEALETLCTVRFPFLAQKRNTGYGHRQPRRATRSFSCVSNSHITVHLLAHMSLSISRSICDPLSRTPLPAGGLSGILQP